MNLEHQEKLEAWLMEAFPVRHLPSRLSHRTGSADNQNRCHAVRN